MRQIAEFFAVLACGLFAGAAVYVNLVEHPARMECGVEIAAAEFPPSYRRGTIMQVTLAAVCLLSSIAAWLAGATFWWVVAGVLQVSVIPFTLVVILPTNKQLLNPALDRRSVQTDRLLARWGRLHTVRSILSGLALLLFLYLAIFAEVTMRTRWSPILHHARQIAQGSSKATESRLIGQTYEKLSDKQKALEYYRKASMATSHNPAAAYAVPFAKKKLS
jgi:hypothetical protein